MPAGIRGAYMVCNARPDVAAIAKLEAADSEAMIRGGINITLFVCGAPRCLREPPGR